ncbi:hypothetical protein [Embleya sp. NPDC020630]|uniref:hypothetical protein n=1 Tax=Embleya sp. NPDC020630 TaxID=3363979 RepID=UPI0037BD39EE
MVHRRPELDLFAGQYPRVFCRARTIEGVGAFEEGSFVGGEGSTVAAFGAAEGGVDVVLAVAGAVAVAHYGEPPALEPAAEPDEAARVAVP